MEPDHAQLSAGEPAELRRYRAVSRLAIAACLAAAASPLSLAHPVLWLVPMLAAGLAVAALRSISRNPDTLVGRTPALVALGVALLFGAWSVTRLAATRVIIPWQSRRFALDWLVLVREGQLYQAHQETKAPVDRLPADVDLRQFYMTDSFAKEDYDKFLSQPALRALVKIPPAAQVQAVRTVRLEFRGRESLCLLDLEIANPRGAPQRLIVRMAVERLAGAAGESLPQWRVRDVRLTGSTPDAWR